jgi:hypothetical protein
MASNEKSTTINVSMMWQALSSYAGRVAGTSDPERQRLAAQQLQVELRQAKVKV